MKLDSTLPTTPWLAAAWLICVLGITCAASPAARGNDADCLTCAAVKPRWFAEAAALYMDRATADSRILMQNTSDASQNLNADDFNFDWVVGFEASLTRRLWNDDGVEFRYLDLRQFDSSVTTLISTDTVRVNSDPPLFLPNVQSIAAELESEVFSIELNHQHVINDSMTLIAGLRYVSMDDDLATEFDSNPQRFSYDAATRNDLYGLQIGVIGSRQSVLSRCLSTSAVAKVGVYGNDAEHRGRVDTGAPPLSIIDSADTVAFVGEFGLSAILRLGNCVSVRGGYAMMVVEGVAVATDQLPRSDFFNSTGSNDEGGMLLHGAHLAIELQAFPWY